MNQREYVEVPIQLRLPDQCSMLELSAIVENIQEKYEQMGFYEVRIRFDSKSGEPLLWAVRPETEEEYKTRVKSL